MLRRIGRPCSWPDLERLIPTQLRWTSPSPYLESAEGLLAYDRGSGQSRLRQYNRSIAMVADHQLWRWPRNWTVIYPSYLPKKGPPGLWYPRRANSDWITLAAEEGDACNGSFFGSPGEYCGGMLEIVPKSRPRAFVFGTLA